MNKNQGEIIILGLYLNLNFINNHKKKEIKNNLKSSNVLNYVN